MSSAPKAVAAAASGGGNGREGGSSVWGTASQSMNEKLLLTQEEDEEDEQSDEEDLWDVDREMTPEMVAAALAEEKTRKKVRTAGQERMWRQHNYKLLLVFHRYHTMPR